MRFKLLVFVFFLFQCIGINSEEQPLKEFKIDTKHKISILKFSPDGRFIVLRHERDKEPIEILDVNSWKPVKCFEVENAGYNPATCFSPDGHYFALGTGNNSKIFTTTDWKLAKSIKLSKPKGFFDNGICTKIYFSENGNYFVIRSSEGFVNIWQKKANDWKLFKTFPEDRGDSVPDFLLSADNKYIIFAHSSKRTMDWEITIREIETWKEIKNIQLEGLYYFGPFSPNGKYWVYVGDNPGERIVTVLRTESWEKIKEFLSPIIKDGKKHYEAIGEGELAFPASAVFSSDNRYLILVIVDSRHAFTVWDTTTWRQIGGILREEIGDGQITFSPDGKRIISTISNSKGTIIKFLNNEDFMKNLKPIELIEESVWNQEEP